MRMIECDCGTTLQAANDDELLERAREHIDREHPDMKMDDEQLREFVAHQAYDATDS